MNNIKNEAQLDIEDISNKEDRDEERDDIEGDNTSIDEEDSEEKENEESEKLLTNRNNDIVLSIEPSSDNDRFVSQQLLNDENETHQSHTTQETDLVSIVNDLPTDIPPLGLLDAIVLGKYLLKFVICMRKNKVNLYANLSKKYVTPRQCFIIAHSAIAFNNSISIFTLNFCESPGQRNLLAKNIWSFFTPKIGNFGSEAIFQALRVNKTLTSLSLENNGINDLAMPSLAGALRNNMTLTHLSLKNNSISSAGVEVLSTVLDDIPDSVLISIDFSYNPIGDDGASLFGKALRFNDTLTNLNIHKCDISIIGVLSLFEEIQNKNCTLHSIDMHPIIDLIDEATIAKIEKLSKMIQFCSSLEWVYLSGGPLPTLKLKDSRWVHLSGKKLSDFDCILLSFILKENSKILTVDISKNEFGPWASLELLENISNCRTLQEIDLSGNKYFDEVGEAMSDILSNNTTLKRIKLSSTFVLEVQMFSGREGVSEIDLRNEKMTNLEKIIIGKLLLQNFSLYSLNEKSISNKGKVWDLSNCELELYEVIFIGVRIERHNFLERIVFNNSVINQYGAIHLANATRNHVLLESIDLEHNNLYQSGGKHWAECIEHNQSLKEINLSWNSIGNLGVGHLSIALKTNSTLLKLDLRGNELSFEGIQCICEGLIVNIALEVLLLRWNHICNDAVEELATALLKNRSLTHLDIEHHVMEGDGVESMGIALERNMVLQVLKMNGDRNDAKVVNAESIGRMLSTNTGLHSLAIGENNIGNIGCIAVIEGMKENKTLKHLDLSYSLLDLEGSIVVFDWLGNNSSLLELNLEGNNVGTDGAKAWIKAMSKNKTLQEMNLMSTNITEEGTTAIVEEVEKYSKAFISLYLQGNRITDRTKRKMKAGYEDSCLVINFE